MNPNEYIEAPSGFVLIGDIAGFSSRVNDAQRELVFHLWKFLNDRPELADGSGNQAILNGTGDGALIAFPRNADPNRNSGRVIHWSEVVQLATEWVEWMGRKLDSEEAQPRLRVGIHQGPFQIVKVASLGGLAQHGGFQVVGLAPNMCARVTGLGDAGDIVMSQFFVQQWCEASTTDSFKFDPALDAPAFQAFVKHNVPLDVRRIPRPGPLPKRLANITVLNDQLKKGLAEVERLLLQQINAELGAATEKGRADLLDQSRLSARVSVWTANKARRGLECFHIRWHHKNHSTKPGATKYSIAGDGAGGPGRAYCSMKPIVITGLPAVDQTRPATIERYCKALQKLTGLDPDITRRFSSFSRSFVCFPVGLQTGHIDAVICVDSEHPLDVLKKRTLNKIADDLSKACNTPLAALLRLNLG